MMKSLPYNYLMIVTACLLGISPSAIAQTQPSAGMMRYPDVSEDRIVFSYADDLWTVPREGGQASPLASPPGPEALPRFSPDGKAIAFVGHYDGAQDIYVIPTDGGTADRMTYHGDAKVLCDWHPDGKSMIYSTNAFAGLGRQLQLMSISKQSPNPTQLPVPYGGNGAISADGQWLAYNPHTVDTRTWKRYRGGMASDVWLFDLKKKTAKRITDHEGTDTLPMWQGDTVYYLSDAGREHRMNIWSYDTNTGERKQVTEFTEHDCKWPAIGPGPDGKGEIVLQNSSSLYLISLPSGDKRKVEVSIPGDRPKLRTQRVDASEFIESTRPSPTGKRVVVEARGDIWTLPAEKGIPRNLTRTNGVAERFPAWSPDGQWIAYFSDKSGEYELYITQSDGRGGTKQLTSNGTHYRYAPTWSPNSKYIAFTDKAGALYLYGIDSGEVKQIDTNPYSSPINVDWSHNSQWITYAKTSDEKVPTSAIWVYRVADGTRQKLTSGFFPDSQPTFDRKGDYIFFISNRAFNSPRYEDLGTSFIYSDTDVLMAMPLRADVEFPFLPKSDEETWKDKDKDKDADDKEKSKDEKEEGSAENDKEKTGQDEKADESNGADKPDDQESKDDKPLDKSEDEANSDDKGKDEKDANGSAKKGSSDEEDKPEKDFEIEVDGIEQRAFQLPVGTGGFGSLGVNNRNQLVYSQRSGDGPRSGQPGGPDRGGVSIKIFDLKDDKKEPKTVVSGAGNFEISADGKKLLVQRRNDSYVINAAPGQRLEKPVPKTGMVVMIDPREEWRQLFMDAWRIERDFFYDPNMHGVDWVAVRKQYEPMLEDCVSRLDVSFVISEMISELNVGHAYYREAGFGGSAGNGNGPGAGVGLLGCRFSADGDVYKIAELYEGAPWDVDARNPLKMAGAKAGEYLLEVNEMPLKTDQSPYAAFQDLAGQPVTLTISEDKTRDDKDRRVTVTALANDAELRFRAWIERNRRYVDEKTGGKVGYIYVVNTGIPGQNDLVRQYYGQLSKDALIIDDRWNGGGQIPTRFIEMLNRPVTNYWAVRDGRDWTWPPDAHHGPKCMLINGMAGSGGDMFPALFRQAGLGKLIGMRTWGGLVGISGNPSLIDGAAVTAPTFAYYELDGTWGIEGHGVDPDLEVIDDPAKMTDGGDPQLDAAIELMLAGIKERPYTKPDRPAYPDRSKFGIKPEDR